GRWVRRYFLIVDGKRTDVRRNRRCRAEARYCFTHAAVSRHARKESFARVCAKATLLRELVRQADFLRDPAVRKNIHGRLGVTGPLLGGRSYPVRNEACCRTAAAKAGSADADHKSERTQNLRTSQGRKCACER